MINEDHPHHPHTLFNLSTKFQICRAFRVPRSSRSLHYHAGSREPRARDKEEELA